MESNTKEDNEQKEITSFGISILNWINLNLRKYLPSNNEESMREKIKKIAEESTQGKLDQNNMKLLLSSNENMLIYLQTLNKHRSKLINLEEAPYSIIKSIMISFIEKLSNEIPLPEEQNVLFYEVMEYILILSQTFYHNTKENNETKRVLLQDELTYLNIWKNNNLWLFLIFKHIETEKEKKQIALIQKESERETKAKNIYSSTVITYEFNMKSLGISKDTIRVIKEECKKKYNLSDEDIPDLEL